MMDGGWLALPCHAFASASTADAFASWKREPSGMSMLLCPAHTKTSPKSTSESVAWPPSLASKCSDVPE